MKRNKILVWLLSFVLCFCMLPVNSAQAANEAMSFDEVRQLVNGIELHPQRTGYPEMDKLLEDLVKPYEGKDNYTKIGAMYDWVVTNIEYSWEGYSQDRAPAYDKFTLKYDLAYETGLPKAFPDEIINRSYHTLTAKKGVCYDFSALFAVIARYIGVESYVHTGEIRIGTWRGHHGWTVLKINGTNYIFDTQQDNRKLGRGENWHSHFGIPPASAGRFTPETEVNAARDAGFLPVTAERIRQVNVTVKTSRSGTVTGGGLCVWGEPLTLKAAGEIPIVGWYDAKENLLSKDAEYTFTPEADTTISAMFQGDYYFDVPAGKWYTQDVCRTAELGLMKGENSTMFVPEGKMTRAMMATVLSRLDRADVSASEPAPFLDVPQDIWYAQAVNWAYQNGIVNGVTENSFDPMGTVTREQAAVMMIRYLESLKDRVLEESDEYSSTYETEESGESLVITDTNELKDTEQPLEHTDMDEIRGFEELFDYTDLDETQKTADELDYVDADEIDEFARESIARAQELKLMQGYVDGSVRPKNEIIRSEGAVMIMRLSRFLTELQMRNTAS